MLLYRHDKANELTKEGSLSFVLFATPFISISTVSRGHPSIISLFSFSNPPPPIITLSHWMNYSISRFFFIPPRRKLTTSMSWDILSLNLTWIQLSFNSRWIYIPCGTEWIPAPWDSTHSLNPSSCRHIIIFFLKEIFSRKSQQISSIKAWCNTFFKILNGSQFYQF